MGNQSATRLQGDRYQHLYSWYEILRLLDEDSPYAEAWVEHPEAGAADDLTLHPKAGSGVATRFMQVKFHVDHRALYSFDTLLDGTKETAAVLPKLFAAWRKLRAQGEVEVWLVSTWPPAPHPDLGAFLSDSHHLLDDFFSLTDASYAGEKRSRWRTELQAADDDEILAFSRALRFQLGYSSLRTLEDQVDDRMGRYALKMGPNWRAVAVDEISLRIQAGGGRKRFTRQDVLEIIEARDMKAAVVEQPAARLWIHGWVRQGFDQQPTVELNWTGRFNRDERRIPSPKEWRDEMLPELRRVRDALASTATGKFVDLRGKLPLTAALAVGAVLPEVAGFKLRVEQPTGGETYLWRSDAPPSAATLEVKYEDGQDGDDLLVGISIVGNGLDDLKSLRVARDFGSMVYAEPASGTGNTAVTSAGDAAALATASRDLLRAMRAKYKAKRVHLVLYTPSSFAVFLGQRLNAVGTVVTYERTADGGYQESVTLMTG
jgi:hypothetical protein